MPVISASQSDGDMDPAPHRSRSGDEGNGPGRMEDDTMDPVQLLIQLASGALGGNAAGSLLKNLSLGTVGNSLAGILGGGIGGQLLGPILGGALAGGATGLDPMAILSQVASGGVGGGVVMVVIGILKSMFAR